MKRRESISHVMSTDITVVLPAMKLSEVYEFLGEKPFHHLPVVEGRKPVGMISSTDLLRLVYGSGGGNEQNVAAMLDRRYTIDDVMSNDLRTLPDTASVFDAASSLADGLVHSVLVVNPHGDLVGIVTATDLIRYLRDL